MLVGDSAENCGGSAVALIDKADDVPVVQVVVWFSRTVKVPQIQFIEVTEDIPASSRSLTPVVAQMQFPIVLCTTEILQLQYIDKVVDVCCAGCCMPVVFNNRCLGR